MKLLFKSIFLILFLNINAIAQNGTWYWQNPLPQGNSLFSVHFFNEKKGWAVGSNGTILSSIDGGKTWVKQNSGTNLALNDVFFIDASEGWVVGEYEILHTTNGGASWQVQYGAGQFNSVTFIDRLNGWAAGGFGSVAHTINGGFSWEQQTVPATDRIFEIKFTDLENGWIVGELGNLLLHTSDGGTHWVNQNAENAYVLTCVDFIDSTTGWIAGYRKIASYTLEGAIYCTKNGGVTWTVHSLENVPKKVTFLDSLNGFIVMIDATIYKTTDGGENWQKQNSYSKTRLIGISFLNPDVGWVVGQYGTISYTKNGGDNWNLLSSGFYATLRSIAFRDQNCAFTAAYEIGSDGQLYGAIIFETKDKGITWWAREDLRNIPIKEMIFIDASNGWAIGVADGFVMHTTDGGATWSRINTGFNFIFNDIAFSDKNNGWIVGWSGLYSDGGLVIHTSDGGITWNRQVSGTQYELKGVTFINYNIGWVVGENGTVIHTCNGGLSWQRQISGITRSLYDVEFVNPLEGTIVGDSRILHTEDGGETWEISCYTYNPYDLVSVSFSDTKNGLAVGWMLGGSSAGDESGVIYITTDGGKNWQRQTSGTSNGLNTVCFTNPSFGLAVGDGGTILRYQQDANGVDLVASSITYSSCDPIDTDSLWVVGSIFNRGNKVSGSFSVQLLVDGKEILRQPLVGLPVETEVLLSKSDIGPLASGIHKLSMKVDCYNTVAEYNENNNELIQDIIVKNSSDLPPPRNLSARLTNQGNVLLEWEPPDTSIITHGRLDTLIVDDDQRKYVLLSSQGHADRQIQFANRFRSSAALGVVKIKQVQIVFGVPSGYTPADKYGLQIITDPYRSGMGPFITGAMYSKDISAIARLDSRGFSLIDIPDFRVNMSNEDVYVVIIRLKEADIGGPVFDGGDALTDNDQIPLAFFSSSGGWAWGTNDSNFGQDVGNYSIRLVVEREIPLLKTNQLSSSLISPDQKPFSTSIPDHSISPNEFFRIDQPHLEPYENLFALKCKQPYSSFEKASSLSSSLYYRVYKTAETNAFILSQNLIGTVDAGILSFTDSNLDPDIASFYTVSAIYNNGESRPSNVVSILHTRVDVLLSNPSPESNDLFQNYPNPFNVNTIIGYAVKEKCHVLLKVYNILGQEVKTLVEENKGPGKYQFTFDATNFSSGIYCYKIQIGNFQAAKKMLLLK